mgnify:CR=1 FL=1
MNRIDDRLIEETVRATMQSNHAARVLIFESSCWTRFNLEYAKSCSSRDRDRRTIGALCSRGVPGVPMRTEPFAPYEYMCASEINYLFPSPSPFAFGVLSLAVFLSFFVCPAILLPPFTDLRTLFSLFVVFLMHVPLPCSRRSYDERVLARAWTYTRFTKSRAPQ